MDPLTDRELDILRDVVAGLSNKEIALKLHLTGGTVKWYINQVYSKLDVHNRHQAGERASQLNLFTDMAAPSPTASSEPATEPASPAFSPVSNSTLSRVDGQIVNPYKGLRAFQEADTEDFFGRAVLTERLLALLADNGEDGRFLVVVGPSGSGKSSVVRAGLVPALRRGALPQSERWLITDMLPGTYPFEELEAALLRAAISPLPELLSLLVGDQRGLVRAVKRLLPSDQDVELVLLIDQFEELFTLVTDEHTRLQFIETLLAAASDPRSRIRLVLTLRADFYDRPLLYPRLAELMRSYTEIVVPLTEPELERAVAGPAEHVGLILEPGLVDIILRDVNQQPGTLPLLQFALTELFEHRQESTLTLVAYRAMGGISGALVRRADELYETLDTEGQAAARQLFLRLITLGEGTEDTRRRVLQAELPVIAGSESALDDALAAFGQYRLLTFDHDPLTHGPTIEIAHEALIRSWGRLREWLTELREDLQVQRRLMAAAAEWAKAERDPSFLASGARLTQFEALATTSQLALNQEERTYLETSIDERTRREAAEQERRAREVRLATELQNVALVTGSQAALADGKTDLAIALAMQAISSDPSSPAAQVALGQAAYAPGTVHRFTGHAGYVKAAFGPDGRAALSASGDKTMILWDVATRQMIRRFSGHTDEVTSIAFSPDGRHALTGAQDRSLILWDTVAGQELHRLIGHSGPVGTLMFSPDGRTAISGSCGQYSSIGQCLGEGNIILWDLETGREIRRFAGYDGGIIGVVFSGDGRTALSSTQDTSLILWDVATGQIIRRFEGHANRINCVALSPDGRYAASGAEELDMILWDAATGQIIRRCVGHHWTYAVAFSPDSRYVLSGSNDTTLTVWDVTTGQAVHRLQGHRNGIMTIAVGPTGRFALTGSTDTTMRLWELEPGQVMRHLAGHSGWVTSVAFSPDSRTILSASDDGSAILWDAQTGQELWCFSGTGPVQALAFAPDGRTALLGIGGRSDLPSDLILWNVETGQELRHFVQQPAGVMAVAFSPDGRTAVSSGYDGSLLLWDVVTGQLVHRFIGNFDKMTVADFSPDGHNILSAASDGSPDKTEGHVILWDVATGQIIRRFAGRHGSLSYVKFSPDGHTALSSIHSGTLILWDVATGHIARQFTGHTVRVHIAVFSPDGHMIFSGSADNTSILWDAASGRAIRHFVGPHAGASSAAFSPDGRSICLGFPDGRLELWRIDSSLDELLIWTHANRYVPDLTAEQRELYRLTSV